MVKNRIQALLARHHVPLPAVSDILGKRGRDYLSAVATVAPGTKIIFEYNVPKDLVDEETQRILAAAMTAAQARGEPQGTFFEPAKLAEQVRKIGLKEVSDLGPDEAEARYFKDRTDGLRPLAFTHYMRAWVGTRSI